MMRFKSSSFWLPNRTFITNAMSLHWQGTFCVLNICVYMHSHVILRKSQSGEDDNFPHVAEEGGEAWRGSCSHEQGNKESEPGQVALTATSCTVAPLPCSHCSHSCFGCFFFFYITFYPLGSVCRGLWNPGLWVSMGVQKRHFQSCSCTPHFAGSQWRMYCFAPENWAPPQRTPLRMPTETLLTTANKSPAFAFIFTSSPFPGQNEHHFCTCNSLLTMGT